MKVTSVDKMPTFERLYATILKQEERWGLDHDRQHERFEWLGLIAEYAAKGQFIDAAALCFSAEIALIANNIEEAITNR